MACYHFTVKLDRKPDKMPVGAETHLDYIHREGRFANLDIKRALAEQKFSGNMLCPVQTQDKEAVAPLYRSMYGSIIDNGVGIELSDRASLETVQVALAVARKKYGDTLAVSGTTKFKARVLVAADEMEYPIRFADPVMQKQYEKMQEEKDYERKRIEALHDRRIAGSRVTGSDGEEISLPHLEPVGRSRPPAGRKRLQVLSMRHLDEKSRHSGMLLSRDDAAGLEQQRADRRTVMRRDVSRGIKEKVEDTAEQILQQSEGGILAASHADYINRRENYASKGGCLYTAHHLPKWAHGSAKTFFKAADLYERANGTRYREIEFALPNELGLKEHKEIIETFIERHLKGHYYAYAIHDKIGAMSNGEHNTHVHIMFSERELDDIERTAERSPKMFFYRANKQNPEKGGCKKAAKWNGKDRAKYLCRMREDFARIQNDVLEKYGENARVDHRSLKAQYMAALQDQNFALARLLDRYPEVHVGPIAAAHPDNPKVVDILAYRQYKLERSELVYAANVIEASIHDKEMKKACDANVSEAQAAVDNENEEAYAGQNDAARVVSLKEQVEEKMQEIIALNDTILWQPQAMQIAREKVLSPEERTLHRKWQDLKKEHGELVRLLVALPEPSAVAESETSATYETIMGSLDADIDKLEEQIKTMEPNATAIEEKLAMPEWEKKIHAEADAILQDDFPQRKKLQAANEELSKLLPQLKAAVGREVTKDAKALADGSKWKLRFTAEEIAAYLKESYQEISKEYKQQQHAAEKLKTQVFSFERAQAMAKDVYLKGGMKQWREKKRRLDKSGETIAHAKEAYERSARDFATVPKPKWYQSGKDYQMRATRLAQTKAQIDDLEKEYAAKTAALQSEKEHMDARCQSPAGIEKIAAITKGILWKNQPLANQYEEAAKRAAATYEQLAEIKDLQKAVQQQVHLDKGRPLTYSTRLDEKTPPAAKGQAKYKGSHPLGYGDERSLMNAARNIARGKFSDHLKFDEHHKDFAAMDQTEREAELERTERLL